MKQRTGRGHVIIMATQGAVVLDDTFNIYISIELKTPTVFLLVFMNLQAKPKNKQRSGVDLVQIGRAHV